MSGADTVPVATLLLTVTNSIVEVFILCLAGYILARAGVTDKATQRKLNVINVSLFTPALLFSKVAFSLTPAKLKEMWIIPLGFFVVTGMSAAVAWVLAKMFKLKKSQRAFAMCAAMFQNSNSLPIALIQSLVVEVPGLKWDEHDTKDQMLGRALTYLVLYSTLGMMFRWSWGVKLLSQADDESDAPPQTAGAVRAEPEPYVVTSPEADGRAGGDRETDPFFSPEDRRASSGAGADRASRREASPAPSNPFTTVGSAHSMHPARRDSLSGQPAFRRMSNQSRSHSASSQTRRRPTRTESGREFWGLPQFPKDRGIVLEEEDSSADEEDPDPEWGNHQPLNLRRRRSDEKTGFQRFLSTTKTKLKKWGAALQEFLTVPMYAALLSVFIALIPPLQAFLGKLKPVEQAIRSAGACSIPVTLVVLGAFFYSPPQQPTANGLPGMGMQTIPESSPRGGGFFERKLHAIRSGKGLGNPDYPGENRTVLVAVLARMIITPLLLLPVIAVLAKYDLFEAAEDPVFILSATLLVSSPPALTLAQITQAASGDAFERLISKTISWSYAVMTPPLTLAYVVVGLVFGRL